MAIMWLTLQYCLWVVLVYKKVIVIQEWSIMRGEEGGWIVMNVKLVGVVTDD